MLNQRSPISDIRYIECVNSAGEEIPAFAVMRIVSTDTPGVITVGKPNADSQLPVVFNGPQAIPATSGKGVCTGDYPAHALYDTADGTPAIGDDWGAGNASWKLRKGKTGVKIAGTAVSGRVQVTAAAGGGGGGSIHGKLEGSLAFGGSATLSVWAWNGSAEADTGDNITVYDWLLASGQAIVSGAKVIAVLDGDRYYVNAAECAS